MRWTETVGGFLSQSQQVSNWDRPSKVQHETNKKIWKSISFVLNLKHREDKCLADSQWERRWDGNMSFFHRDVREAEWIEVFLLWRLQGPMMDLIWVKRMRFVKKGSDEVTVKAGRWLELNVISVLHSCARSGLQALHYKHGLEVSAQCHIWARTWGIQVQLQPARKH